MCAVSYAQKKRKSVQELFTKIMAVIANLSFNFNFFQPDCSVESPYWQNWVMPRGCNYCPQDPVFEQSVRLDCKHIFLKTFNITWSRGLP